MMTYEITVEYTEALVKRATRRFLVKFLGWDFLVVCLLMFISLGALVALGQRDWFVGAVGAVLLIAVLVGVAVIIVYHRRSMTALRKMKTPQAKWRFDEDGIGVETDLSTGSIKWRAIEKLWCFPEVWLLFTGKGVYSTLPASSLSHELKTFIINKVQETGAKISQPGGGTLRR
jgi:hypothetical protein